MVSSIKVRLGAMMFVTYTVWGAWYVTINTYLTDTLRFTGTQAGAVFGTVSVASMISPVLVGLVADRYFATEKVMAVLYAIGAAIMYLMTRARTFPEVYGLMLAFCMCYFPTIALTNTIGFRLVDDPGREFPAIRLMGTFGWIVINNVIGFMRWEKSSDQFLVSMFAALAMVLISLFLVPASPPEQKMAQFKLRDALGLDALVILKNRPYRVFAIASVAACIPITFYYSFANDYLNDAGMQNAAGKMTLGQASEVVMMLLMPLIFRFMSVRAIFLFGLVCWTARYLLLGLGNPGDRAWMFYAAILLHGASYDFFFLTGQLYTDQVAQARLRNTAQGLILFATFGAGMLAGSLLSGGALDYFSRTTAGHIVHSWPSFWFSTAGMTAAILVMVALAFRTSEKIQPKGKEQEAAGA